MPEKLVDLLASREINQAPQDRMQLAMEQMKSQMPAEAAGVRSLRPMNWFDHLISPGNAAAVTLPFGQIAYNPDLIGSNQSEIGDTLAHELTHVGQAQKRTFWDGIKNIFTPSPSYYDRPDEKEAYGVEDRRKLNRQDISLGKKQPQ